MKDNIHIFVSMSCHFLQVVDMGCSECGLMQKLIRAEGMSIQELTGVDIDGVVLQCNMYKLKPLMTDYLNPSREHQLTVRLYQGVCSINHSSVWFFFVVEIRIPINGQI